MLHVFPITEDIKKQLYKMNLSYFADPNAKEDVVEIAIPEERRDEYKSARENNDLYAMCTNKIRIPCMGAL